jgi:ankyrin repeat protein
MSAVRWSEIQHNVRMGGVTGSGHGYTLLHACAQYDNPSLLKLLLKKGVPVNAVDKYNNSPLAVAVQYRKQEIVRILLQNGANIHSPTYNQNRHSEPSKLDIGKYGKHEVIAVHISILNAEEILVRRDGKSDRILRLLREYSKPKSTQVKKSLFARSWGVLMGV